MQGILAQLVVLFVAVCALSAMVSVPLGRGIDPFFITRPFTRWMMRQPARVLRAVSRGLHWMGNNAWREGMKTRSLLLKWILFPTSLCLVLGGVLVSIPAEIFGEIRR